MNTLPSRPTADDLLLAALDDLELVTGEVLRHNFGMMKHPRMRAWVLGADREPQDGVAGIVSTAPSIAIRQQLQRGEQIALADVSAAIQKMQFGIARVKRRQRERQQQRAADHRAA